MPNPPSHGVIDVYNLVPIDAVKAGEPAWTARRANTLIAERNALIAEVEALRAKLDKLEEAGALWRE